MPSEMPDHIAEALNDRDQDSPEQVAAYEKMTDTQREALFESMQAKISPEDQAMIKARNAKWDELMEEKKNRSKN